MSDIKDRYTFVSRKDEDFTSIVIKGGKFNDVIYNYGEVSIPKEDNVNEDGTLPFRFEYTILDNVGIPREEFDEGFFTFIGDILVDIISDQSEEDDIKYVTDD
jgi:tRNA splicing ligase